MKNQTTATVSSSVKGVFILAIFLFLGVSACTNSKQLDEQELTQIKAAVENKLATATKTFESGGIEAVANYSKNEDVIITKVGKVFIVCSVVADFYDPNDKVIIKGNEITFPISMFAHAVDGLDYMKEGWKFRDLSITAFAQKEGAYHDPIVTKSKDYECQF